MNKPNPSASAQETQFMISKTRDRANMKESEHQQSVIRDSTRGFGAVVGYLKRFPRVVRLRILKASIKIYE